MFLSLKTLYRKRTVIWPFTLHNYTDFILILSIIPIPYLYFIPTISTIYSLSVIIGVTFSYKFNEGIAIFIGILPHGILEIYLTSIELSMLFLLNAYIRKIQ